MQNKCLIDNEKEAKSRGLCEAHYSLASEKVKRGLFTWAQLESYGLSLPPKRVVSHDSSELFERKLKEAKSRA